MTYTATAPAAPGDYAASLELSSSESGPTEIPVVLRSLVNPAAGGTFSGVLTGGNGRQGNVGQDNYFSFTVPPGTGAISAALALAHDPLGGTGGVTVGAYLVSPDGNVVGSGQNYDITQDENGTTGLTLEATVLTPAPGTWTLVVTFTSPTPGTEVADPFQRQDLVRSGRQAGRPGAARQRRPDADRRGGGHDPGDDHQHRGRARGLLPRPPADHDRDDDAGAAHPGPRRRVEHVDAAARRRPARPSTGCPRTRRRSRSGRPRPGRP